MSEFSDQTTRSWSLRHSTMSTNWLAAVRTSTEVIRRDVDQWARTASAMRSEQRSLQDQQLWRSGPRTMLAAINAQYRELAMTAGFAWLLRPDGHHGARSKVLEGLHRHLAIQGDLSPGDVEVVLEETRGTTRADLVVHAPQWTIVVEAKTFAIEQPRQLERLHHHWSEDPSPTFVFLTRGHRAATTAADTADLWTTLTWSDVARIARTAIEVNPTVAPGVYDYLATLEAYHRV